MTRRACWLAGCLAACGMVMLASGCVSRGSAASPAPRVDAAVAARIGLHHPESGLYTAGQPDVADWSLLACTGIRTVVNLRPESETPGRDLQREVEQAGLRYVHLPVTGPEQLTVERARQLQHVLDASDAPVLLHCASGNRAGGLLAISYWPSGKQTAGQALQSGQQAGMTSTRTAVERVMHRCPVEQADALQAPAG